MHWYWNIYIIYAGEKLDFSAPPDMSSRMLEEDIVAKQEEFQTTLQQFHRQCKRNEVVGSTPRSQLSSIKVPILRACKITWCIPKMVARMQVKLELKLAAGYSPKTIAVEEGRSTNARWIVLERWSIYSIQFIMLFDQTAWTSFASV